MTDNEHLELSAELHDAPPQDQEEPLTAVQASELDSAATRWAREHLPERGRTRSATLDVAMLVIAAVSWYIILSSVCSIIGGWGWGGAL